jgi:hypothetical protein
MNMRGYIIKVVVDGEVKTFYADPYIPDSCFDSELNVINSRDTAFEIYTGKLESWFHEVVNIEKSELIEVDLASKSMKVLTEEDINEWHIEKALAKLTKKEIEVLGLK